MNILLVGVIIFSVICYFGLRNGRKLGYLPIIAFIFLFLVPKISLYFIFSTVIILLHFIYTYRFPKGISFILSFFILFSIVFILTSSKILFSETYYELYRFIWPQLSILILCSFFIRTQFEFRKLMSSLLIILFISYVLIGYYQFFTNEILAPWIQIDDVKAYTSLYDIQRFRSFLEMHPANSANGIFFVLCLSLYGMYNKKLISVLIFTISTIALILTYTRMSYITYVFLILVFLKFNKIINMKTLGLILIFTISFYIIYITFLSNMFQSSSRLLDLGNYTGRIEMWANFFSDIHMLIFGKGYFIKTISSNYRNSSENYFIQQFIYFGIFSVFFYIALFWKFFNNIKLRKNNLSLQRYNLILIMMLVSFCLNMMSATGSENMLFLVFGLSFSYRNVVELDPENFQIETL